MKHTNVLINVAKTLLISAVLTSMVSTTYAASPGGPKPKCPLGEIAVLKNGHWVCAPPSIQAKPTATMRTTSMDKAAPSSRPERAKPDLIVYSAETSASNPKVMVVHVQNLGASKSSGGQVKVQLLGGASSSAAMPDINPGQIRLIYVNFRGDIKAKRATIYADSTKVVTESNEGNNSKAVSL